MSIFDSTVGLDFTLDACRICLQNNGMEDMVPLFSSPPLGCELTFSEKIEKCAGIEIKQHEKLSSSICDNCIAFLNIAYKFRSLCWNSQNYLLAYVVQRYDEAQVDADSCHPSELCAGSQYAQDEIVHSTVQLDGEKFLNNENDDTQSSFTHSEGLLQEYEECWLEGEHAANSSVGLYTESTNNEAIKKSDGTIRSKTIGILSDGAAVIEDKTETPLSKSARKEKRKHICDICGNIYDRRYSLIAHMRRHRDEKPYECELCGQAFHCNFELSRHIRKHTGIRPYICEYCKRAFGDRSTLLKHERIHRNERPYSCAACGKSFTYSSVLKVHQLTHTGEKPYNCEICGKRFSRSHHLRAHLGTLLHQNDPQSKILLKKIKRAEDNFGTEILVSA